MTEHRMREMLAPFVAEPGGAPAPLPDGLYSQLAVYLDLLLRWNARTNLTAVREPEEIVTRHFGEGLFTGLRLRSHLQPGDTLLDLGSGAGFPGLPVQLVMPQLRVTLAESQGKKASFLREAVRVLGIGTQVWAGRVETMPEGLRFHAVTLRAVDRMQEMLLLAGQRLLPNGIVAELTSQNADLPSAREELLGTAVVPGSRQRILRLLRPDRFVPRGTA